MTDNELYQHLNQLRHAVGALERKVAFLYGKLGIELVDDKPPVSPIEKLILDGDRMAAIKLYAQEHHVGLADAKREVEALAAKLGC